ncbi:hypothetical protein AB8939_10910 [Yersinia enterocolitica]|uniref:BstA-like C-terminal domain-containing protein n=1 Tax=Yersinia bercovieri TaxID=634 RepID=A0A2G4U2E7_YERBE|nr:MULTISPECIES: hypothetical protein [Yersinia]ELI8121018.1 hypothetical protein [Yersinia enterocolitica]OJB84528.1 hypothetical protein A9Q61_12675 [Yersinia ruckeri]PHZ27422.1 hypothetical protein CS533_10865 [Yersinia bercovieri]HDU2632393.1 hypothetical protein [Yersinia enterocolitica]
MDNKRIPSSGVQLNLTLVPVREVEIDGIQMGILSDGSPYLNMRGLATMCGVVPSAIQAIASNWESEKLKPRGRKILEALITQGHSGESLYIRTRGVGGEVHAYTGEVCMAVLEYYAFDASQSNAETARNNYRILARDSFKRFIYSKTGYHENQITQSWINYQERILLNDQLPYDYFSVFREIADLMVHLVNGGLPVNDHTVPDGSVGGAWGKYWSANEMEEKYRPRVKFSHRYPDSYRQAAANSFIKPWIYPIEALGDFRKWLYATYAVENLPAYLERKKKKGEIEDIESLLEAVRRPELPSPH